MGNHLWSMRCDRQLWICHGQSSLPWHLIQRPLSRTFVRRRIYTRFKQPTAVVTSMWGISFCCRMGDSRRDCACIQYTVVETGMRRGVASWSMDLRFCICCGFGCFFGLSHVRCLWVLVWSLCGSMNRY